jgi:hypothetical protein
MEIKKFLVTVAVPYERTIDEDIIMEALQEYDSDTDRCAYEVKE